MRRAFRVPFVLLVSWFIVEPALAQERQVVRREAAELLPASTLLYIEVPQSGGLLDLLADHPLKKELVQLDGYRQALASPKYLQFRFAVGVVETRLGLGWREALKSAAGAGLYAAYDPVTNGAVLLARAEDPAVLDRLVATLVELAREDAKSKGNPDPIQQDSYRDITAWKAGDAAFAVRDGWLVVTNRGDLGKLVLDRLLDGGGDTLASKSGFRDERDRIAGATTAWAWIDMAAVRTAAKADGPLATGLTENPAAELLVGGLIDTLRNASSATAALNVSGDRISAVLSAPHDPAWITEPRQYYFGTDGSGSAPAALEVDRAIMTLATYRDLSRMWLRAGDLVEAKAADELAKAESGLSTLFGGRDFAEEILGSIGPELQLVVARQEFGDRKPQPAVKLPGFALVGRLKDPEVMRSEMRRTFLSLIGFLNVIGAMNGQPQFDFDIEDEGADQLIVTRYVPVPEDADSMAARINYNFSPSIAFVGDSVIVSSTGELARELLATIPAVPAESTRHPNTIVEIEGSTLHDVLADNREPLIAQNMLSEGRSREEAENAIAALLGAIDLIRDARLALEARDGRLTLSLDATLEP